MGVREKLNALKGITEEQQEYGTEVLRDLGILYDDRTIEGVNDNIPRMVARIDDSQTSSEYVWSSQKTQLELTNVAANASSALSTAISTEVSDRNTAISTAVGDEATARSESINEITELIPSNASTTNKLATVGDIPGGSSAIMNTESSTSFSLSDATNGRIQGLTVEGRTTKTGDVINNVGDNGFGVTSCGKNLIKITADTRTINDVVFTVDKTNGTVKANGTASADTSLTLTASSVIDLNDTSTYTLSGCPANGSAETYMLQIGFFGNDVGQGITNAHQTGKSAYPTIIIKSGTVANNLVFRPQLELGSTATVFEPYTGSTASLVTGLPLCSVGDVKDEVDYNRGVVIKRTAKIELNGTETGWGIDTNATVGQSGSKRMILLNAITGVPVENSQPFKAICDKLQVATAGETYGDNDGTISTDIYGTTIRVRITGIATVSDLTTYLASNPLTVVYELAEPYEIPMTAAELTAYHALRTFEDTTNITATDSPMMTVDYLLNTENGQAVAKVTENLNGRMDSQQLQLNDHEQRIADLEDAMTQMLVGG